MSEQAEHKVVHYHTMNKCRVGCNGAICIPNYNQVLLRFYTQMMSRIMLNFCCLCAHSLACHAWKTVKLSCMLTCQVCTYIKRLQHSNYKASRKSCYPLWAAWTTASCVQKMLILRLSFLAASCNHQSSPSWELLRGCINNEVGKNINVCMWHAAVALKEIFMNDVQLNSLM